LIFSQSTITIYGYYGRERESAFLSPTIAGGGGGCYDGERKVEKE